MLGYRRVTLQAPPRCLVPMGFPSQFGAIGQGIRVGGTGVSLTGEFIDQRHCNRQALAVSTVWGRGHHLATNDTVGLASIELSI